MNHLGTRSAHLLVIILVSGAIGVSSGCAAAPVATPPTATAHVADPIATPAPISTPVPEPSPQVFTVGNTNGLGVYLRRTPLGDKIKAWPEGAVMAAIGGDQVVDSNTWRNVRDPEGHEGWMVVDYLVPQAATPVPPGNTPVGAPFRP